MYTTQEEIIKLQNEIDLLNMQSQHTLHSKIKIKNKILYLKSKINKLQKELDE